MAVVFQVGARVRTKCSTYYIHAGMVGTVLALVEPTKTACVVQFDEPDGVELVPVDCLELVESQAPS